MSLNHGARFGHYFETWKGGFTIAMMMNLTYAHHEFTPKNGMPGKVWEEFLGIGRGFEDYSSFCVNREIARISYKGYLTGKCLEFMPCLQVVPVGMMNHHNKTEILETMGRLMKENSGCNVVFHLTKDQNAAFDLTPEEFPEGISNFIRRSYTTARRHHPIRCLFDVAMLNVAVHIRRGDVSSTQNTVNRYVPNEVYLTALRQVISMLEKLEYRSALPSKAGIAIHIFSEGEREDFGPLQDFANTTFHLNHDLFETLHNLALADVFVGSRSGFSSFAKKLARGVTIFPFTPLRLDMKTGDINEEIFIEEWKAKVGSLETIDCERDLTLAA